MLFWFGRELSALFWNLQCILTHLNTIAWKMCSSHLLVLDIQYKEEFWRTWHLVQRAVVFWLVPWIMFLLQELFSLCWLLSLAHAFAIHKYVNKLLFYKKKRGRLEFSLPLKENSPEFLIIWSGKGPESTVQTQQIPMGIYVVLSVSSEKLLVPNNFTSLQNPAKNNLVALLRPLAKLVNFLTGKVAISPKDAAVFLQETKKGTAFCL